MLCEVYKLDGKYVVEDKLLVASLHSAGMDVMIVLHTYLHSVRRLFCRILDN